MKYVYLDGKHNEFIVDDESYAQIAQITQTGKLCIHEWREPHPYTLDNPCVAKNICLQHLLINQPNLTLLDSCKLRLSSRHNCGLKDNIRFS